MLPIFLGGVNYKLKDESLFGCFGDFVPSFL
jgi:hypothetical protein